MMPFHSRPPIAIWQRFAAVSIAAVCLASAASSIAADIPFRSLKEIRERGVVMQQWESSCAAAAVATLLTYGFDEPVSEHQAAARMLERTDPKRVKARGGFSLLDLKHFVEELGYRGNAYKHLGFQDLRVFHAPVVPIDQHGYHHYVVLNGVRGDRVRLADPAFGNRELPISRFEAMWMDGMAFVVTRAAPLAESR